MSHQQKTRISSLIFCWFRKCTFWLGISIESECIIQPTNPRCVYQHHHDNLSQPSRPNQSCNIHLMVGMLCKNAATAFFFSCMLNLCYELLAYWLSFASTLLRIFTPRIGKSHTIFRIYPAELIA